jgi:hypothetical protein
MRFTIEEIPQDVVEAYARVCEDETFRRHLLAYRPEQMTERRMRLAIQTYELLRGVRLLNGVVEQIRAMEWER